MINHWCKIGCSDSEEKSFQLIGVLQQQPTYTKPFRIYSNFSANSIILTPVLIVFFSRIGTWFFIIYNKCMVCQKMDSETCRNLVIVPFILKLWAIFKTWICHLDCYLLQLGNFAQIRLWTFLLRIFLWNKIF